MVRVVHGVPARVDRGVISEQKRRSMLGNSCTPQQAEAVGRLALSLVAPR